MKAATMTAARPLRRGAPTDWHAVAVTRGAEMALAQALGLRGFRVLDLARIVRVRRTRRAKATVEVRRAALPGYLVVEMGPGADWRALCRHRQVIGAVGVAVAGRIEPWALGEDEVEALRRLRHSTAMLGWTPSAGDALEVVGGWYDGARVVALADAADGSVRVRALERLFGFPERDIPLDRVIPLE